MENSVTQLQSLIFELGKQAFKDGFRTRYQANRALEEMVRGFSFEFKEKLFDFYGAGWFAESLEALND